MTSLGASLEMLFPFIVLICLSLICWIYLLIPSARKWYSWGRWPCLRPRNKEQKELEHALAMAVALIMALTFTTLLIFVLIFGVISYIGT